MERRLVMSGYTVTSVSDSGLPNTLRWAIQQVDNGSQPGAISFNIPGGGVHTIHLAQPLPAITSPVVIDGTSQPNYAGKPLIQLDGSGLSQGVNGLVLTAGSSTIEGLSIVGFNGSGIVLSSSSSNLVAANYLGILGQRRASQRQRHGDLDPRIVEQHDRRDDPKLGQRDFGQFWQWHFD